MKTYTRRRAYRYYEEELAAKQMRSPCPLTRATYGG
jgi:hypothetical protein